MKNIEELRIGASVRHKNKAVNGGCPMTISNVKEGKIQCSYFSGSDAINKTSWFDIEDVLLVDYGSKI